MSHLYKIDSYRIAYSDDICPITDEEEWIEMDIAAPIAPPVLKPRPIGLLNLERK